MFDFSYKECPALCIGRSLFLGAGPGTLAAMQWLVVAVAVVIYEGAGFTVSVILGAVGFQGLPPYVCNSFGVTQDNLTDIVVIFVNYHVATYYGNIVGVAVLDDAP